MTIFQPGVQAKLRTAFLEWLAEENPGFMVDDGQAKLLPETMLAWKAWRAATAIAMEAGQRDMLDRCLERVNSGRTINNFAHVPEVVRALGWVSMDLMDLDPAQKPASGVVE